MSDELETENDLRHRVTILSSQLDRGTKRVKDLEEKVAVLKTGIDTIVWLIEEAQYKQKIAAIAQIMSHPEFKDKLEQAIAAEIEHQPDVDHQEAQEALRKLEFLSTLTGQNGNFV